MLHRPVNSGTVEFTVINIDNIQSIIPEGPIEKSG